MDTSAKDCMVLFDTSVEGKLESGWESGVLHQRTRTVKAGPMVYVDCYPVWDTVHARAANTEAKKEAHAKAQKRLDAKNRANRLERLVNANFDVGDIMLTCEYPTGHQPGSDKQAKRDIRNMMNRVKRLRSRRGLSVLKYIYITERTESAAYGVRWHHHVILSGDGLTREEIEEKWTKRHGGFCNTRRAQPTERHLSGFARYLTISKLEREGKNPQQKAVGRSWGSSIGLKEPVESVADKKISIRKAGRVAETVADFGRAKEIFEKLYPGCELLEIGAKKSRWASGVYVHALMRRVDEPGEVEMTEGQDVRALLESIGGLRRRIAGMDRQAEQMRAMNAGAYAEELGRLAEHLRVEYAHALALIEAVPDAAGREALELRYLSGLTWMQIARRMGYEERQVRRIHQRALAAIRAKDVRSCPTRF